ncbi:MAG: ImmA/IrrE family metallo-endopeptidase, partial [bacterium]
MQEAISCLKKGLSFEPDNEELIKALSKCEQYFCENHSKLLQKPFRDGQWTAAIMKGPWEFLKLLQNHPKIKILGRGEFLLDTVTSKMATELKDRILNQVAFANFSIWNANAFCALPIHFRKIVGPVCEDYTGYIIGIHNGLFILFHNIFKLIITRVTGSYWGGIDRGTLSQTILPYEEVVSSIYQVIKFEKEGVVTDFLAASRPLNVKFNDERENLFTALEGYSWLFVIGHELAHFLLDHLKDSKLMEIKIENETIEAFHWADDKEKEFEADNLGFAILLNYIYSARDDTEIGKAITATEIALSILDLRRKVGKSYTSRTHPSPEQRIHHLRQRFDFPRRYYELSDGMLSLSRSI